MDLKLLNERLGISLDSTEEQALEAVSGLKKEAADGRVWRVRAEENLEKLEKNAQVAQENESLKADTFFLKAKSAYKITAAEEPHLRKMYMSGSAGREMVEGLLEARAEREYMSRVEQLRDVRETPVDPYAEVQARAAELIAKNSKLSQGDAESQVLKADPDLQRRYIAKYTPGMQVTGGAQ